MTTTLLARVYGKKRKKLLESIRYDISCMIKELEVNLLHFGTDKKGHLTVSLDGPDSEFIINMLIKDYGSSTTFEKITEGEKFLGSLVDVGKVGYGFYVDIAIVGLSRTDALVPLHRIRDQFGIKKSLRFLSNSLVLVDNFPVEIKITSIDRTYQKAEAEFTKKTLDRFEAWVHDEHERLLIFGANNNMIKTTLEKSNHLQDIYEIEKLGPFEYALVCKRSTRASGILAAIGPKLQGVPMHLFIPKEIEAKLNA